MVPCKSKCPFLPFKVINYLSDFWIPCWAWTIMINLLLLRKVVFFQPFPWVKFISHWLQHRPHPSAKEKLLSFFSSQCILQVNRLSNSAIYHDLQIKHYYYSLPKHQDQLFASVCPTCIYSYREATRRMNFYPRRRKYELFQHLAPCDFWHHLSGWWHLCVVQCIHLLEIKIIIKNLTWL